MTAMTQPIDRAFVEIVPDFDDFAREVHAGVDRAMRDLRTEVQRGLEQVERSFDNTGSEIGREFQTAGENASQALDELADSAVVDAERVGQAFDSSAELAESSITELRRSAIRDFERINREATVTAAAVSGKFSAAFASTIPLLAGFAVAVGAGLGALTVFGLKATAELEQTQISFNSLLGSAEKGKRVFADLQQFAAITPFEFPDVAGAAQRFFAFNDAVGLSDDAVREFLTTLGNVASVTGGGAQALNSVTLAMGQIASSGKVTLDNLNQISEALPGFSGVAAIASAQGKTTAQVMQEISAGSIGAAEGIQALLKGMQTFPGAAGAMEAQSQTLLGVFSTFKDTLSQALVAGFAPVIPEIKAALTEVTPILQEAIADIAPVLGDTLALLLPLIGNLVKAITPIIGPIIEALGPALETLSPHLLDLGAALGEVTVALVPILPLLAEFLGAVIQLAIPALKLLAIVLTPLGPVFNFMAEAIAEFSRAFEMIPWTEVGVDIVTTMADAVQAVMDFIEMIRKFIDVVPLETEKAFQSFTASIRNGISTAIGFVTGIPGRIKDAIGDLGGLLVNAGRDAIRGLWNGIQSMGAWLRSRIIGFAKSAIPDPLERFFGIASPSKFMADKIGEPLGLGIGVGFERGLSSVGQMLADATGGMGAATPAGGAGGGTSVVFGPNSIVVRISGSVTAEQAQAVGVAVGNGVVDAMARRGITTAVRTM
jgi:tape measure domain-containing protein